MKKNQQGIVPIIIIIVAVIALGIYLMTKMSTTPSSTTETSSSSTKVPPIEDSDDLNDVSTELDNTSTTELDASLNDLNSLSNF